MESLENEAQYDEIQVEEEGELGSEESQSHHDKENVAQYYQQNPDRRYSTNKYSSVF